MLIQNAPISVPQACADLLEVRPGAGDPRGAKGLKEIWGGEELEEDEEEDGIVCPSGECCWSLWGWPGIEGSRRTGVSAWLIIAPWVPKDPIRRAAVG